MLVSRDRDAAVDVADDKVHFVIFPAYALSIFVSCGAEVESVCCRCSVYALNTRDPCNVLIFINNDGVYHEKSSAELVVELLCHLYTEHAGVINAAFCLADIVNKPVVNFIRATLNGIARAASANDRINACKVDIIVGQPLSYVFHTVIKLVVDCREVLQDS